MTSIRLAVAIALGVIAFVPGATASRRLPFPSKAPPWLRMLALQTADALGESEPDIARVTLGRYPTVLMAGSFVCGLCPHPRGVGALTGSVAAIRADGTLRRIRDSGLCADFEGCLSICGSEHCGRGADALDGAFDALYARSRGVDEPFDHLVGRRRCQIRFPYPQSSWRLPGRCSVRLRLGPLRNVVTFSEQWPAVDAVGRRIRGAGMRHHRWRVIESPGGWVRRVIESGDYPSQWPRPTRGEPAGGRAIPGCRVEHPRLVAFASADVGFLLTWDGRGLATRNGGRTWRLLRAHLALVAVDFVSGRRGFGLTERGVLLATSDGGRRWRRTRRFPLTATAFAGPPEPVVDFVDSRHGWVAAGSALIFRTADGGRRWTRLRFGCPRETYLGGLAFADSRHGFAACGEQPATAMQYRTYYVTGDGGTTWRRGRRHVDDGYVATVAYPSAGIAYVYADRYGISRREGRQLLFTDDTDSVVSMSWPTPSRGYVVLVRGGLRRTDDGGRHWRRP